MYGPANGPSSSRRDGQGPRHGALSRLRTHTYARPPTTPSSGQVMSKSCARIVLWACAIVACAPPAPVTAPVPPTNQRPAPVTAPTGGAPATPQDTTQRPPVIAPGAPRPYNRVITADAKT